MGLYDDIRVEYPIEGVEPFDDQTKELICYCEQYLIDREGRLMLRVYDERERTPEEKAAEIAESPWFGELRALMPVRENPRWQQQTDTVALELGPDDDTTIHFWIVDGRVKDVVVKRHQAARKNIGGAQ